MNDRPRYYTVRELADVLRVSDLTIRRMIHRGELRAVRVGPRNLRIPAAELERIEETGATRPPARSRKARKAKAYSSSYLGILCCQCYHRAVCDGRG